ncbi:MAG: AAA family ATPase [Sulfuricella sp.]|nr:AAA family ATPase [Sulfuricella sp.]
MKDKDIVLAVATLKGGSGKSTVAGCLAVHWREAGHHPVLIDADPQRSLVRLAQRERALGGVPVHESSESGDDIATLARHLATEHSPVIVDTAGFRAPSTLAALAAANLVLVPVKPSPLDVDVMLDTARALFHTANGKVPRFYCLLTQTTRDSVIARHIRNELREGGFPLLESELINRVGYCEAALFGATPTLLDPRGPAAADIAALAAEIEKLLETAP